MNNDWRANIADCKSLDDLDPVEVMIYLRHQMLCAAKDLVKSSNKEDNKIGINCSMTAESLHQAIENFSQLVE